MNFLLWFVGRNINKIIASDVFKTFFCDSTELDTSLFKAFQIQEWKYQKIVVPSPP